ncbi:aa3-type cytochrome c oxidase subunit IV [Notoacmeibacter sp. MSK16QG-6]|uniref:aa3-type cytochrome c oxidase subunit IV n=1 Tax=Notoacmeibacter sp. MSK16QG-6 TaxID=2957982 RepID=UPI00209F0D16|nr:aa3-type cytochrome c oxidase subunit IV [Notoacmeibacter sp. MSK16QG-6]MCP1200332.1 aa3-type cytochrome c oxidase subunit IV [Notoacmeibacter sp. MSK16QG-6]
MVEHHHDSAIETGAEMDYGQHEKTYSTFVSLTKWSVLINVVLLIAMAFFFFTSAGFFSSIILFIILMAVGYFFIK